MNWKQIIIIVLFMMGMLTACTRQEEISLEASTTEDSSSEGMIIPSEEMKLYVYVCGYVKEPGVYKLDEGARVCDALESAGGTLEDARAEALDQAVMVTDGQTIYVPGIGESQNEETDSMEDDGRININQASAEQLMTLPGIGESKANVILQYRDEHGAFQTVEDLMKIPGIKQGVFDKIKNRIKV